MLTRIFGKGALLPPALLLALAAVYVTVTSHARAAVPAPALAAELPMQWGPWTGTEQSLTPAESKELAPDAVIFRTYENGEHAEFRPVGVLVLWWGSSAAKPHAPEICLTSADYTVYDQHQVTVAAPGGTATVNAFRARRGMTERTIYYWWYTDRGATGDFGAFKKTTAVRGVLGQPSWGAFVRVESAGLKEEAGDLDVACRAMSEELLGRLSGAFRPPREGPSVSPMKERS
jgi:EpsI family protein